MSMRLWLLAGFAMSAMAIVALAQSGDGPLQKLFGTSAASKAKAPAEDPRRLAEIAVELAWLGDPVTFPYFLEARVEGAKLAVRGFVPDKAVREHALGLARLTCSYSVTDTVKEHPSLRVRPGQTAPAQLQSAVVAALREALPRQQAQRLQVQCGEDGKVTLRGTVQTAEEKLAASLALRRLYGCTSVQNLTQAASAPDLGLAKAPPSTKDSGPKGNAPKGDLAKGPSPIWGPPLAKKDGTLAKTDKPPQQPMKDAAAAKTDKPPQPMQLVEGPSLAPPKGTEPAAKKPEPVKEPPVAPVTEKDPAKTVAWLTPAMIATLQKRVQTACPSVTDVKIVVAMNKLRIELTVRNEDQITPSAEKAFAVPELADYREELELAFTVAP
jgi:osmotically-inducible protein OsmY